MNKLLTRLLVVMGSTLHPPVHADPPTLSGYHDLIDFGKVLRDIAANGRTRRRLDQDHVANAYDRFRRLVPMLIDPGLSLVELEDLSDATFARELAADTLYAQLSPDDLTWWRRNFDRVARRWMRNNPEIVLGMPSVRGAIPAKSFFVRLRARSFATGGEVESGDHLKALALVSLRAMLKELDCSAQLSLAQTESSTEAQVPAVPE